MSDDEKAKKSSKASTDPDPVPVIGGTGTLPVSVFGKERERKDTEGEKMAMKTEFVKMEDKEPESRSIGDVLMNLKRRMSDDEKAKKSFIIEKATNKFCTKLVQIEGWNKSSMTEQDKYEMAKHMYEVLEKCSFKFKHCWHLLKDQPKWIWRSTKEDPKRMKTMSPSPTPTQCSGVETVDSVFDLGPDNVIDNAVIKLDQPMGGKSEKGKRKAKGMAGVETVVLNRLEYMLLVNKIHQ
ncbi:hypothetical protein F2P56_016715 [Juglans regia]|uniref:No apical meristem-associated C-terminal domain-containing protein n=1 Tax=Juglans regia TaxID=51240 RepID=A0A834CP92_JUGRE|nr:hypothetical protein F2P56_016715 [Juglans regia]